MTYNGSFLKILPELKSMKPKNKTDQWLADHGLDGSDMTEWNLSRTPDGVLIPVYSVTGKRVFALERRFEAVPRYLVDPPGRRRGSVLYGFHRTLGEIQKSGFAVVVEGASDAMALYRSGVRNVVALLGSQLTEIQAALLALVVPLIVLWMDGDSTGTSWASGVHGRTWPMKILSTTVDGCDPAEFVVDGNDPQAFVNELLESWMDFATYVAFTKSLDVNLVLLR